MTQNIERELEAARSSAALADMRLGKLVFRGPDRGRFLQGLLTNDVSALAPGRGFKTCVLTPKGKLVADFFLYNKGEDFLALCRPDSTADIMNALSKILPLSKTSMEDASRLWSSFYLQGPGARASASAAGVGAAEIFPYPVFAADGLVLLSPAAAAAGVWSALVRAVGEEGILSAQALEVLRVEAGVALPGKDFDADAYPLELNLEGALSFSKGCYMGQETVAHMKNRGHFNRRLAGLKIAGVASSGSEVFSGTESAGRLTSVVNSPRLGSVLGLALLRAQYAGPGARLEVASEAGRIQAEVVALPLA